MPSRANELISLRLPLFLIDVMRKETRYYGQNCFSNTLTYLWDITDLDNIELMNVYAAEITVIDHNQYIREPYSYQAN